MSDFSAATDFNLASLASEGNSAAEEELAKRYTWLVRACARPYFLAGGDSEDLIQEGMLGLLSAIRQFSSDKDTSFSTYAETCIRNRLITAVRSATRNKHTPLNDYVPLESPQFDESQLPQQGFILSPEELLITRESTDEITSRITAALSSFEKKVLDRYLEGMSYEEIAEKVQKSEKSVDNAVQRIRKKLSRTLNPWRFSA